ncbi:MAG: hypothetical protein DRJ34_00685 [Thermoprotei archaeon]|nr:MAG: hypothetical protein DRJ34_00685 [Thermoprotei archaeon]
MPRVNNILISYCGIICEYCPAFRFKRCNGCDEHVNECEFIKCLKKRGFNNCLLCDKFPCKLHEEGFLWQNIRWKIYSNIFLKIMKTVR